MNQETKIIFFDIGGVLINPKPMIRSSAKHAAMTCSQNGFTIDPNQYGDAYIEIDTKTKRTHLSHLFGDYQIARETLNSISGNDNILFIGAFLSYYRNHLRKLLIPDDELIQFFTRLKLLNRFHFGIISDGTTTDQLEIITRLNLSRYFSPDLVLISEDYGEEKVNTNIYFEAIKRANCKPHNAIMIGDNYERDILIPQETGMQTIFF